MRTIQQYLYRLLRAISVARKIYISAGGDCALEIGVSNEGEGVVLCVCEVASLNRVRSIGVT